MAVKPTEEQERARDAFTAGGDLAVVAGAGTGKTSTLVLMAAATSRRGLYLAFNRATADHARRRFGPNVECRTVHSLAYRAVGAGYRDRLNSSARIPSAQIARILGIRRPFGVGAASISEVHQARLVMSMVRRFCFSNDTEIMARHMEPVNGLNPREMDYVAASLVRLAWKAWDDIRAPDGKLRFEHDHYMKMWALARPVLPGEFILLDEAQDTNPVLEEIFLAQTAQRVCVGDPAQQIYAWRAARDVMTGFPADHVQLTRSFRFGPAIAAVANRWLGHADSDMRLTGAGPGTSRVAPAPRAGAVLCRGNADVMQEVLAFLESGIRVAITGGGEALKKIAEAAQQLKAGRRTSHPELFLFPSWGAVQEYAENDSAAQDLKTLVNLVDAHGPETIIAAVDRLSLEDDAEVTVSTAHKAKGREWASVRVGPGFGPPAVDDDGIPHKLGLEEARLIYVAVTRAKQTLDIAGLKWADDYEKAIAPAASGSVGGVPLINLPLTSQLRYPASPVSRFLTDHLPGTARVVRDYLERIGGLPRPVQPTDVRQVAWAALGHAIDFRLRLSLASSGRELLARVEGYLREPDEDLSGEYLARLCFVAAFYADVYRTGEVRRHGMLAGRTPDTTLDSLASAVPGYVVDDIGQQMGLADTAFKEFRALPRRAVTCGPVFAGSADIGGADADFILGGLLLDCKATTMPRKLGADEINQLAGYLLLDYFDEFGIRQVGLYLSRQGAAITWDVSSFLEMLGGDESLPELRAGLRAHLRSWRQRGKLP